jgi:hypothetical protein
MKKVLQVIALVMCIGLVQAQKNSVMVGTTLIEITGNLVGDVNYDDIQSNIKSYCLVNKKTKKLHVANINYELTDDTKATELYTTTVNIADVKLLTIKPVMNPNIKSANGKPVYKVELICKASNCINQNIYLADDTDKTEKTNTVSVSFYTLKAANAFLVNFKK